MKNTGLSKVDLTRAIKDAGFEDVFIETTADPIKQIVTGNIHFKKLPCGIALHCSDIIENVNGSSTSLMGACMSINILFEGQISFAVENKRYHFRVENRPLVFINLVPNEQLFTRYFLPQSYVKKLNISVTREWLIARCEKSCYEQFIEHLLSNKQAVYRWQSNDALVKLAEVLFNESINKSATFTWQLEQRAFQLFSQIFELFFKEQQVSFCAIEGEKLLLERADNNYENQIDKMLFESEPLGEISKKLGASISTLQRYFKTHHQLTLKAYIRNQKLEYARRALIFEHKSIGEASYLAGYNHVSNFSSAFKKHFSITPAALQDQYRKTKNL